MKEDIIIDANLQEYQKEMPLNELTIHTWNYPYIGVMMIKEVNTVFYLEILSRIMMMSYQVVEKEINMVIPLLIFYKASKRELINDVNYSHRKQTRQDIFKYI